MKTKLITLETNSYSKCMNKKEAKKIIEEILKEWKWESKYSTYKELSNFIVEELYE